MTMLDFQHVSAVKPARRVRPRVMTRDDILTAARALMRSGAFSELTMRALAHEVGVTPPALYDDFLKEEAVLGAPFANGAARPHRPFQRSIAARTIGNCSPTGFVPERGCE